jgi:hypothetical protein
MNETDPNLNTSSDLSGTTVSTEDASSAPLAQTTPPVPQPQMPSIPQTNLPPAQPEVIPPSPQSESQPEPPQPERPQQAPKSKKPYIIIIIIAVVLLLIFALTSLMVATAYGKVSFGKPDLERSIERIVISIPFMPKTPRYVLESTTLAHRKVSKHSFDISFAGGTGTAFPLFGTNQLDAHITGNVDYSNPENITGSYNIQFGKDLELEARQLGKVLYLKINKVPEVLSTYVPMENEDVKSALQKWIMIDSTPASTEARDYLTEKSPPKSATQSMMDTTIEIIQDEKVLREIKYTEEKLDKVPMYKLHLSATDELVDYIGDKLIEKSRSGYSAELQQMATDVEYQYSNTVKDLEIDVWVDKKDNYMSKSVVFFNYLPESGTSTYADIPIAGLTPLATGEKVSVTLVANFDNFGEEVVVEAPTETMNYEEFMRTVLLSTQSDIDERSLLE